MRVHTSLVDGAECDDDFCHHEHINYFTDDELAVVKAEKFWAGYNLAYGMAPPTVVDIAAAHVRD